MVASKTKMVPTAPVVVHDDDVAPGTFTFTVDFKH